MTNIILFLVINIGNIHEIQFIVYIYIFLTNKLITK